MRIIPRLNVDDKQLYQQITAKRQAPRRRLLLALRTRIFRRYDKYEKLGRALHHLRRLHLGRQEIAALTANYDYPVDEVRRLKGQLFAPLYTTSCPYCLITTANDLDHYAPKAQFPELSVLSINLVPSCTPCNRKYKAARFKVKGRRLFLNPYVDKVPARRFVRADIQIKNRILLIRFGVRRPTSTTAADFSLIERHFAAMGLADRFERLALTRISDEYGPLQRAYRRAGSAGVKRELKGAHAFYRSRFGENCWQAVLYRALMANRNVCRLAFDSPT